MHIHHKGFPEGCILAAVHGLTRHTGCKECRSMEYISPHEHPAVHLSSRLCCCAGTCTVSHLLVCGHSMPCIRANLRHGKDTISNGREVRKGRGEQETCSLAMHCAGLARCAGQLNCALIGVYWQCCFCCYRCSCCCCCGFYAQTSHQQDCKSVARAAA